MNRYEAIKRIVAMLNEGALVVHANGMISRESFIVLDQPANFYMIGSMGLASSIGLGLAINRPERRVVVLDGDGNVLMSLGSLAMVGDLQPRNFVHIVLDNEVYGSTGGQRSISSQVELERIAAAAGYARVARVTTEAELSATLEDMLSADGPAFLLVKVSPENVEGIGRVSHPPEAITERFARAVTGR